MMLAFLTNKVLFVRLSFKYFAFLTQIVKNCAIREVSTKNVIICDVESINMWILADKACNFMSFPILRHNDVITISY